MLEIISGFSAHFWSVAGTVLAAMIGTMGKILWDRHATNKREKLEREAKIAESILKLQENQKIMDADQENLKEMIHDMRDEIREDFRTLGQRIDDCLLINK